MSRGVVNFSGSIHQNSMWELINSIYLMDKKGIEEVDLFINSKGGNTQASIEAYQQIRALCSRLHITSYNIAACQSAAFTLFLGAVNRKSTETSSFMFHQAKTSFSTGFTSDELKAESEGTKLLNINTLKIISANTKIEDLENKFYDTYYFDQGDAKEQGVINEIVGKLPTGHEIFVAIQGLEKNEVKFKQKGLL